MYRTNGDVGVTKLNFLALAVAYNSGIAIPFFWMLLPKKGNSNTSERKQLMNRFLSVFGVEKIAYMTADREFKSKGWLQYLMNHRISFCLRILNNTKVWNKHKNQPLKVSRLFGLRLEKQMSLNKSRTICGIKVYLSCAIGPKKFE